MPRKRVTKTKSTGRWQMVYLRPLPAAPKCRKKLRPQPVRSRKRQLCCRDCAIKGRRRNRQRPRLSLSLEDGTAAAEIAAKFHQWAKAIDPRRQKLRTFYRSLIVDGEAFMLRVATDYYGPSVPQLDYVLYEADQVATPLRPPRGGGIVTAYARRRGPPLAYDVLNYHPGDDGVFYGIGPRDYRTYPAKRRH